MDDNAIDPNEYVERVLRAYRQRPTTMGTVRQADRLVAVELHARGVALGVVENAFIMAAAPVAGARSDSAGADPVTGIFPAFESGRRETTAYGTSVESIHAR